MKMGLDGFQNQFLESCRVGFYFRVLEEGEVGPGDPIELVSRDPGGMTVRQGNNLLFFDKENLEGARALSDKSERACEGCWCEAFRPPADATRLGRQNGSV